MRVAKVLFWPSPSRPRRPVAGIFIPTFMSNTEIEKEIQSKGLNAPRVTPADIEANIAKEIYFTAGQAARGLNLPVLPADDLLTICVLTLQNGFTVVGTSACASPENFDAETGRKAAREKALDDVWKVMGYALKERLFAEAQKKKPGCSGCGGCSGSCGKV